MRILIAARLSCLVKRAAASTAEASKPRTSVPASGANARATRS